MGIKVSHGLVVLSGDDSGPVSINKVLFYVAFIKHLLKICFVQGIVVHCAGDHTLIFLVLHSL